MPPTVWGFELFDEPPPELPEPPLEPPPEFPPEPDPPPEFPPELLCCWRRSSSSAWRRASSSAGLGCGECRGLAGRLFLGEQLGRFLGQGVVGVLHLGDEALGLFLDGLGLLGLLGGDVALLLVDGLLRFHLGAQGLGFLHHVGVVLVHIVQEVPVRGEGLERGGSQKKIEERRRAGTVHGAGAVAELVLQLADARGSGIDATLSLVHAGLGIVALGFSRIEGDLGAVELLLHGVELLKCRVGLGLLLGGRDGVGFGGGRHSEMPKAAAPPTKARLLKGRVCSLI